MSNTLHTALCSPHGSDIDSMTHCITDYINFCVETTVPSKLVRCFPNNKPWVTSEIKALLNEKKRVFRSGDKEELRRVQKELRQKIRKGKDNYRRKLEKRLEQNNARDVWRGLQNIAGHGKGVGRDQASGDKDRADELNLTVIRDFVSWSELNQLQLNTSKTKEMIVNFRRKASHFTLVNIQGLDIEVVESYKFLGVHLNNKLEWTDNTHALYKKGQSRLHLLRRLSSFGVCKALLLSSVMASAIFYAVVCWRAGSTDRDRSRLNKLIRRASSVLDGPLDSIE
ncbi:hypothetical protein N1851_015439 [Merluccius polli]|uniref:Alkylated DNA repair protein AlkB homologue 8 N-terminal domain-containing protein n=1 Tax=Merluccius polli TaxID=89951 RepID=A0AA47MS59_MERPO|nr:hypothetical protein N1851_015439 [Merluccius polli]